MSFNRYYQDELSYLRDLGAEFASENPELAPYLSRASDDPDVERLLEAFAFLTARLRERLDDELPELTHTLLGLLWPQVLRPIPCTTVLAFEPIRGAVSGTQQIAQGVEVQSRPVEGGVACIFRTCFDVALQPLRVAAAELDEVAGRSRLKWTLTPIGGIAPEQLDLGRLRLFLNFDRDITLGLELRLLLLRHLRGAQILRDDGATIPLPDLKVVPVGFSAQEAVLPVIETVFDGFRLLQEYFAVPQKFLFLDLVGLPPPSGYAGRAFTLVFEFDRSLGAGVRLHADQMRLNCTPIVNLFGADSEPIALTRQASEYRLLQAGDRRKRAELYAIEKVVGWQRPSGEQIVYEPYESFRRVSDTDASFYRLRLRPSVSGHGYESYLSFVDGGQMPRSPATETVVARLSCCNGSLPELLPVGGIDQATSSSPTFARFSNVGTVTPHVHPPLSGVTLWSLIGLMARNFHPATDLEGLRTLLTTLDCRAAYDRQAQRRQELLGEALQRIDTEPMDTLVHGHPVRGRRIRLEVDEAKFGGVGETLLFGDVLDAFLRLFANINACHRFVLRCSNANVLYQWPTRTGSTLPI
jgi:type VI secretion system protein ImpG